MRPRLAETKCTLAFALHLLKLGQITTNCIKYAKSVDKSTALIFESFRSGAYC